MQRDPTRRREAALNSCAASISATRSNSPRHRRRPTQAADFTLARMGLRSGWAWHFYAGGAGLHFGNTIFSKVDALADGAVSRGRWVGWHHFRFTRHGEHQQFTRLADRRACEPAATVAFELLNSRRTKQLRRPGVRRSHPANPISNPRARFRRHRPINNPTAPTACCCRTPINLIAAVHCYDPLLHASRRFRVSADFCRGRDFPGPPRTPLVPDPGHQPLGEVGSSFTTPSTEQSQQSVAFRGHPRARAWASISRPACREFGLRDTDPQSRVNFAGDAPAMDAAGQARSGTGAGFTTSATARRTASHARRSSRRSNCSPAVVSSL